MTLKWTGGSGTYKVQYRVSLTTTWTTISGITDTSYTIAALVNFRSYDFRVGNDGTNQFTSIRSGRPHGPHYGSACIGGGQINAIVKATGTGTFVAGGDVSAFHRSLDSGHTWHNSSRGVMIGGGTRAIAALVYHSSGVVYGVSGSGQGSAGRFWKSTDDGQSWVHVYNGTSPKLEVEANSTIYPRRVGWLIAVDPANANIIYLATMNGLLKSTNGGASWTTLALGGRILRGLALTSQGVKVYVAAEGNPGALYRVQASDGSLTRFDKSPAHPEEVLIMSGTLYVAASGVGSGGQPGYGIYRLASANSASSSATFTNTWTCRWGLLTGVPSTAS